jgi:hypothetical protein
LLGCSSTLSPYGIAPNPEWEAEFLIDANFSGLSTTGLYIPPETDTGDIPDHTFLRTEGLQTHPDELDRFLDQVAREGGQYLSDLNNLKTNADGAVGAQWPYNLQPGIWENRSGNCVPAGFEQEEQYFIRNASTDIWAMALAGYLLDEEQYFANAKMRLLEFTTLDFPDDRHNGSNQCALDLGSAAAHLFESAWLMESAGYADWTTTDKQTLAEWGVTEVIPVTSFGIEKRKNNWGVVMWASTLAAANYAAGPYPEITLYDKSIVDTRAFLDTSGEVLQAWLSNSDTTPLDSQCDRDGEVFGLQPHGGFPDELRRTGGTLNCAQESIDFACSSPSSCSGAFSYQQKATNGLARVCEIFRRMDGNGARCFDLAIHGGDNPSLFDAIQFAIGGDVTTPEFPVLDHSQGMKFVAGQYYQNGCLIALEDDENGSYVRGGRDYAYTRITHAPGVAYAGTIDSCN